MVHWHTYILFGMIYPRLLFALLSGGTIYARLHGKLLLFFPVVTRSCFLVQVHQLATEFATGIRFYGYRLDRCDVKFAKLDSYISN